MTLPIMSAGVRSSAPLAGVGRSLGSLPGVEVATDLATRALYTSDASNYRVLPAAVAFPRDRDSLAALVRACAVGSIPLTMRGAGTSIAGNAIGPGVVVDCSHGLDRVLDIDADAGVAVVEPGVVLDDLTARLAPLGLRVGPDPSTHSRCTIGGMVGNDACGAHSVMWGSTADNVAALEVVDALGHRRQLGPLWAPDAASDEPLIASIRAFATRHEDLIRRELPAWSRRVSGYALDRLLPERGANIAQALVGSEGTCALFTAVTLRLVRAPVSRVLLVLGFPDEVEAAAIVPPLLAAHPYTVESLSTALLGRAPEPGLLPEGDAWLLIEARGADLPEARDHAARLLRATDMDWPASRHRLLVDPRDQDQLWRRREDSAGRAGRLPDGTAAFPGFEDATVPPDRLAGYLVALRELLQRHEFRGIPYGHFGEGCIHLRLGFGLERPGGANRFLAFMADAADLVVAHGGTLSGEHGDGRARSALLPRQFSPEMLSAFAEWKAIWDPRGLLNPGVLVAPAELGVDLRRPRPALVSTTPVLAYDDDGGDLRSAFERCSGVGRCVSHQGSALMCPSFRATGQERDSTRGRARLLQEMVAGSLGDRGWRSTEVRDALDLCLSCKGCLSECPAGVDMASYKSEFLSHHYAGRLRPRSHYALGWLPVWLRLAARLPGAPAIVNAFSGFEPTHRVMAWFAGMSTTRAIPRLAPRTFVSTFEPSSSGDGAPRVTLWPDTFNDHLSPEVPHAAVRVLRAAGLHVDVPNASVCCGLTWITTGQLGRARAVLRRSISRPELAGDAPILVLEPSCAAALRRDLPELLPDDPLASRIAERITTMAELLDVVRWTPTERASTVRPAVVQPHCHQQAVLGFDRDRRWLAEAGVATDTVLAGCCGLAGNFGAEAGHEAISRGVAELALLPALRAAPEALVVADGFSCRTQIESIDGRRPLHLAQVLAARLGSDPTADVASAGRS